MSGGKVSEREDRKARGYSGGKMEGREDVTLGGWVIGRRNCRRGGRAGKSWAGWWSGCFSSQVKETQRRSKAWELGANKEGEKVTYPCFTTQNKEKPEKTHGMVEMLGNAGLVTINVSPMCGFLKRRGRCITKWIRIHTLTYLVKGRTLYSLTHAPGQSCGH